MKRYIAAVTQDLSSYDLSARIAAAENPKTRSNILERLALDTDYLVRTRVARNLNTPVSSLYKLCEDPYLEVRGAVADNPHTPIDILAKLSKDITYPVRYSVIANPNTPAQGLSELFETVAYDDGAMEYDHELLLKGLQCNPNTPEYIKDSISEHKFSYESYFDITYSGDYDIADAVCAIIKAAGYEIQDAHYHDEADTYSYYRVDTELIPNHIEEQRITNAIQQQLEQLGCTDIKIVTDDVYRED